MKNGLQWKNINYCPYCEEPHSKLSRHLRTLHASEKDVIQYLSCKDLRTRKALVVRLRNFGNHLHNRKVLRSGEGNIVVCGRMRDQSELDEDCYLPCVYCLGYYSKPSLNLHANTCRLRQVATSDEKTSVRYIHQSRMLLASELHSSSQVRKLLAKMPDDLITGMIKGDHLLNRLCSLLCLMYGSDKNKRGDIRRSLRLVAKILIELRKLVPGVKAFTEFVDPVYIKSFVMAAKNLTGYSDSTKDIPESRMSRIGSLLRKVAMLVRMDDITNFSSDKRDKATAFESLLVKEWSTNFSANCFANSFASAEETESLVIEPPITFISISEDVKILSDYLTEKIRWHSKYLKEDLGEASHYNFLQKASLAFVILFNMWRGGFVSNLTIEHFQIRQNSELLNRTCLSKMEQGLTKQLKFVEVIGKREQVFPIFFTDIMRQAVELLIDCRTAVGVPENKRKVFVSSDGVQLLGYNALKEASEKCGAKRPEVLWAPELRKQVMTMTQLFNFEKKELDALEDYLGLNVGLRNVYYRLPHEPLQVAKVSKIIYLMERGGFVNNKGKSLEELNVDLEQELKGKKLEFL